MIISRMESDKWLLKTFVDSGGQKNLAGRQMERCIAEDCGDGYDECKMADKVSDDDKSCFSRFGDHCSRRPATRSWPRSLQFSGMLISVLTLLSQIGCDKGGSVSDTRNRQAVVPLTNMILIKAGTFIRQKYPVTISRDFWLAKYEVTQGEYQAVMGKNPSHFPGGTNRPVEKVRHSEALAYCAAVTKRETDAGRLPRGYTYRLPTEAEWEYACRAGTTNLFSFGDDIAVADQYAWTLENSEVTTHPIGLKRPNPWGLYDMHGNVWEWTSDWFVDYPAAELKDPSGPPEGKFKVFRGGGWNHAIEFARSRNRFMMPPTNGIYFVGFRIALGKTQQ